MAAPRVERRAPRADIELACTLRRSFGSPIVTQTVNVGTGGMLVSSRRPLTVDERLRFELADLSGRARVLREQQNGLYALRFEHLADPTVDGLRSLVAQAG